MVFLAGRWDDRRRGPCGGWSGDGQDIGHVPPEERRPKGLKVESEFLFGDEGEVFGQVGRNDTMHSYTVIYEFAASAGALEGYVYSRKEIDMKALPVWVDNLLAAYRHIPAEIRREFQPSCDQTLGRAICSLIPLLGEGDEIITKIRLMVLGPLPGSPDAFEKKKWFQE